MGTKTPLTDAIGLILGHSKDDNANIIKLVKHARRMEADRARLMECLRKLQPLAAAYGLGSCPLMSEQSTILHASESARALLRELGEK